MHNFICVQYLGVLESRSSLVILNNNLTLQSLILWVACYCTLPWGRFSKAPETFRACKAIAKSRTLRYTELFYSHILKMKEGFLHSRSLRRIHFPVFRYRWSRNSFNGPEKFPELSRNGPHTFIYKHNVCHLITLHNKWFPRFLQSACR